MFHDVSSSEVFLVVGCVAGMRGMLTTWFYRPFWRFEVALPLRTGKSPWRQRSLTSTYRSWRSWSEFGMVWDGLDHWVCLGHVPPKWIKLVRLDNTGIVAGGVEWHQRFGASGRSEAGERSFQAEEPQMPMADASVGCRNGIATAQDGNFTKSTMNHAPWTVLR